MEDHASKPSNRIPALEKYLARWSTQTFPVKSAEQEHLGALRAAEDVLKGLSQNPADNIDEIIPCAARIQKLKARHEDAEGRKEREYQHNVWKQQEALLFELFNIFGHERTEQLYQSWCHRPGQSPTGSTGSDTITPYATDTTTSPSTPGPNQPKSKDESSSKNTRNQMPSPPNTESEDEPITQPTEPDKPERNSAVGLQKRPAEPPAARPTKRPRSNNTQGPLTGDKTIEFEQVYQKSHAESKHVIVKHDEFWYILECKEHRVRFNNVRGAMVHLTGKKHKDASVSFKGAIRTLGTRVLNCDADKASQNNDVTQRPTYSEMGRPVTDIPPPDGQSLSTRRKQSLTGIKPKPGEVYTTFWSEAKQFFAILVLPWRNVGQFGISFSLSVKDTKLIKNVPSCYCYNQNNELYELKPEYRLGGEHYSKREYPIMYFDAPVFPTDCQVDWVVAGDFDLYDPKDASIPFKEIVDGFIASRNSGGGAESGKWWKYEAMRLSTKHNTSFASTEPSSYAMP
ncbi:hypothetical protein NW768_000979 [Fusarium equiseti]|uniref:Uncharacterized protein n=1 Tax=Fusarium equiseti TaxID=61235 RepID=A0ABQ8RUD1_FUSEQ|nr:hypothetical protein NW768_000979 [Fusarium equiseti]